ncbi:MAG: hypothetical protein ABSH51_23845 [Solirubrobacteraceae bacterium]|jgi:hypothetical protein
MTSIDNLPGDQRAVLQLVLGRGRSYNEIARLLSINPDSVRERALAAFDSLGPETRVPDHARAQICDYLLGQLPADQIGDVRNLLAHSPSERAWARVLSSELAPIASGPLPEIPVDTGEREPPPAPTPPPSFAPEPEDGHAPAPESPPAPRRVRLPRRPEESSAAPAPLTIEPGSRPPSSRAGGIVVIGVSVVLIAIALIVILTSGGSSPKKTASKTPTTASTPAARVSTTSSAATTASSSSAASSTSTATKVVAQINLTPPSTAAASKAAGIAEVLREGATNGIAIVAQNIPANTTKPANAYAVWLYNSPTDAHILGFVNPGVAANGRLSTAGALPSDAAHYKQLIVTLETSANPKTPGQIILQGTLTGL